MKRLLLALALLTSLATPAMARPVCAEWGCTQRAGYSVQTSFDYIGEDKITDWDINYSRLRVQTKVGNIYIWSDGRVTSTNNYGKSIFGSYHYDEYGDFVIYFDGWDKVVVLHNPITSEF